MLRENEDRVCAFFAVDYDWRLGARLSAAVDAVCRKREPARVAMGSSVHDFQWPDARQRLLVTPTRIGVETLGLAAWLNDVDLHLAVVNEALRALEISVLKRVGFKVIAFLPLQMTQAEAIDLMFGSFLAGRELLSSVFGPRVDPLLHVEAELSGFKYALDLTTVNTEQASRWFLSLPNLDKMTSHRVLDPGIRAFHDRVAQDDSFLFDIDAWKNDFEPSKLKEFATSAFDTADELAKKCLQHLRSQPDSPFGQLVDAMLAERGIAGARIPSYPPLKTRKPGG